jgi:hypothetical protein
MKKSHDAQLDDEPITEGQRSLLRMLCDEAQRPYDETLTHAEAARRIEALQQHLGHNRKAHGDGPLQSLGRAIGDAVIGSDTAPGARPRHR